MLTLKKIKWKNFLSTGNNYNEITLNEYKTTLIAGENGSGKSTMMDALCFGLFGRPFRKINKPQLLNSITGKNLEVAIDFSINNNEYRVKRGIKKTVFEIYKNGKLLKQNADSRDQQEFLEKYIIKMNYKTFCQIVILGNANFTPFMELSPSARRNIVEDLLDIQVFSIMNSILKERNSFLKNTLQEIDVRSAILENTISLNKKHLKEMSLNNEKTIHSKQKIIISEQRKIESIEKKKEKVEQKFEVIKEKNQQYLQIEKEIAEIKNILEKIDRKIIKIEDDRAFYEKNEKCNECEQLINEEFKERKLIEYENKIIEYEEKKKKPLRILEKKINKLNSFDKSALDIQPFMQEINEMNADIRSSQQYITNLQNEISELQTTKKPVDTSEKEKKELKQLQKQKNELISNREMYNIAGLLLKDTGIKAQIIRQYIPVMNKLINKHLEELGFFCKFEIDENFNEKIKSRYRDEFSYASFSEGEKMRINLSLLFSWREIARMRNASAVNLLILDEIMDSSLDAAGTEEFLEIIHKLSNNNQIIIISHKHDQIIDKFDRTIKFTKYKNFSKLE